MNKLKSIKMPRLKLASLFLAVLLLFLWVLNSLAQESQENKIDISALTQETQKMQQQADQMTLVWWIPEEFWWVSSAQDPTVTKAQTENLINVLRPYTLIIIVDGKIGPFGGVTYKPEAEIRAGVQIKDSQENYYRPLNEDKINADAKNFLSIMKPIFANMLGPMGQNMHFFFFPAESKNGNKIAEAKKEGAFSVKLREREFRWRLPLGSLLPPKTCPGCKEKCSGAWNFCPWCGTKLPK